ncbi:hypothetical protein [Sphingomonas sp.]|uniref:hypothetical protein n=1 Tax=Sphingomonas sp. TaxID=28214 RepID=UPI003AFFDA18
MAKALKTAALVVGAVALVATGIGAAAGAGIALGLSAGTLGTIATIATVATVASTVLSLASAALTKPPGSIGSGNATKFKIDKESGQPYAIGRTYSGGNVVHRAYYGAKNAFESWVTVHSLGPIHSMGPLEIDKVAQTFSGSAATGQYAGSMWLQDQLGACPESTALTGPNGAIPGWGATSKLSGYAADLWTLKFDEKGKVYPTGVPQRGRVVEGVLVYDPRLDSTYLGGSGACRLGNEATYVYSENPALHALTWAFGRIQNGRLVAGGGMKMRGLSVPNFTEWANVCDANGWKVGGLVYSTTDNAWDVLRMIAQAGGGEVMPVGALLSCMFSAPRVSIATITSADVIGDLDVPASASRRLRRNTVIPKVRLETHGWEMTPLDALVIGDFVAVDGGTRPKEVELPLVQQVDQGAQLGLYDIWDARELDGIVLPLKVYALGYLPGDCLTVDIPEAALNGRDVIVRSREIDGASMGVTLTCRSETAGKHAFCLGKTGTTPPTPDLTVPPAYPAVNDSIVQQAIATSFPLDLSITAADTGSITISNHTRRYTDGHADVAVTGTTIASSLSAGTFRAIYYDDTDRTGGAVIYGLDADDINARVSPTHPGRHFVGYVTIPTAGSPPSEGGGATPPGGRCVTEDTPVLIAGGGTKAAGDLVVGDLLLTRHEERLTAVGGGWGVYPVEAVEITNSDDVWQAMIAGRKLRATGDHRVWTGEWVHLRDLPGAIAIGSGRVVKLTVTSAHTYVSNGVLSHNLKPTNDF